MVPGEIGILPEYREVTGTPRGVNGPTWAKREKRKEPGGGRAPLPLLVRIGQGKGGGAPLSFPSSSSFPLLLLQLGKKGVLLPVGVGLPLGAPSLAGRPLPLAPLYMGAGGTLEHTS